MSEAQKVWAGPAVGRPVLGEIELLVYGECVPCEWRCALPEGSRWPKCPGCGEQVWPDGRRPEPGDADESRAYRRLHGTGYIALYVPEISAAELLMLAHKRQPTEEGSG